VTLLAGKAQALLHVFCVLQVKLATDFSIHFCRAKRLCRLLKKRYPASNVLFQQISGLGQC